MSPYLAPRKAKTVAADPVREAFYEPKTIPRLEVRGNPEGGPVRGGAWARLDISGPPCRAGCTLHNHVEIQYIPDPTMDEALLGWTAVEGRRIPQYHRVGYRCIVCSEVAEDLEDHICLIYAVAYGTMRESEGPPLEEDHDG